MFARTKRLTLRPGWPEDATALTAAIAHEEVAFKLARLPWPYTKADAQDWLSRKTSANEVSLLIFAHEGATPRLVGVISLLPDIYHGDAQGGAAASHELGYWLTPDAWGKGYATEAGMAMLGIARHALGLKRLLSGHFLDNPASGKVLAKLGFQKIGVANRHCLALGVDKPCAVMTLALGGDTGESCAPERLAA
ncbi:MAG: GNAT family N-acetyltransferase [Sphingomonas sp.]|jgi:RimJ/RimL family protein N-acetyltransferase